MKTSLGTGTVDMQNEQRAVNGLHNNIATTSGASSSSTKNGPVAPIEPAFDAACVKLMAESIGIPDLSDTCANMVATSVTYVLKDVIEQSKKLMSHARRKHLIGDDIDGGLMLKKFPPLFGFTAKDGLPFRYAGSCGRDLFIVDERDVEITPVINASAPKIPSENALKVHWLVIDGEQPAVPENPTPTVCEDLSSSAENEVPNGEAGPSVINPASKILRKTEQVQIKTMTTHALSVEQQIYFKEITETIMGSDETRRLEALQSLQTDAGLQALLPRFSLVIVEGVRCNIAQRNLAILIYLMRMVQSLVGNSSLSLERNLHELLPAILSCILSKQLCIRPDADNHWVLREFASRILATICRSYEIDDLRSRVAHILTSKWFKCQTTMSSLYGSIFALNELGVDTVRTIILPHVNHLYPWIVREMKDLEASDVDRSAAEKSYQLLLRVLVSYVKIHRPTGLKDLNDYISQFGGFGEAVYNALSKDSSVSSTNSVSNNLNAANSFPRSRLSERRPSAHMPSRVPSASMLRNNTTRPPINRPQASPAMRNSNLSASNRMPSVPNNSLGYYVTNISNPANNQPGGAYMVRPPGIRKMVLPQRTSSSSSSDAYSNI